MFTDIKQLLKKAQRGRYAVGHFNINNLEIMQGVVAAAEKLHSPVILATTEGAIRYAGLDYLYALAETAARKSRIPIALHLDHGRDLGIIKKAIRQGYSSVMIDGSHEKFEQNVRITKKAVQMAHRRGIAVEAELGTIGGAEESVRSRTILYTNPAKAKEFVERTGCDVLAVAIGTSHGAYKFTGTAKLRFDLLQEIRKQVQIPLVLHGASAVSQDIVHIAEKYGAQLKGVQGVPELQLKSAIRQGICKVNTDTDLRIAFDAGVRKALAERPADFDPRQVLGEARNLIQKVVEQRIKLLGSAGKA